MFDSDAGYWKICISLGMLFGRTFAPQQVQASAAVIGLILVVFSTLTGVSGHLLGANPAVNDAGLARSQILPELAAEQQAALVPSDINALGKAASWLVGLLATCSLAAMQSTGAAHMTAAGTMLSRGTSFAPV